MQILNVTPRSVRIKAIHHENEIVKTFVLDISVGGRPGQFVNLWIPGLDEKPFSIAMDDGKELTLAIAAVGPFSNAVHEKKVGDFLGVRGPFGQPFDWKPGQTLALLGGGYGAAPLLFLAKEALKDGCKVHFIVGARRKDLLLYNDAAQEVPGLIFHAATDDGSEGHHGYNTQILEEIMKAEHVDCVCTVGPEGMMKRAGELAEMNGADAQISVERYMKCGFGICGNCVVDGLGIPVCTYGPVMHLSQVKLIEDFGKYHRDDVGKKHYS